MLQIASRHRHASLTLALAAALAAMTAVADTPAASTLTPDTDDWKCPQCPFLEGAEGDAELGALSAKGANASFGRYTGIDHGGTYADAGGSGQVRSADGSYANYDLERLGLTSREGEVEGGREGRFDLRISYDGQPTRLYDTAVTPYRGNGANLALPTDWVAAGSTGGMTALEQNLAPVGLGYDRHTVALLGRFFASPHW